MAKPPRRSLRDNLKITVLPIRDARDAGWGVFARRTIYKGELIARFDGTIYVAGSDDELPAPVRGYPIQIGTCRFQNSNGLARYLNHACWPHVNCGLRPDGWIVARRRILPWTELVWDFSQGIWPVRGAFYPPTSCKCGKKSCRGFSIGCQGVSHAIWKKIVREGFGTAYLRRAKRAQGMRRLSV